MTRCLKCGSTLAPHSRFCSICGTEVVAANPQHVTSVQPNVQPNAVNPMLRPDRTAAFGSPAANPAGAHTYNAPDPERENRRRLAIALGSGAGLIAVAGLLFAAVNVLGAKKPETGNAGVLSAPPTQTVQAPLLSAPAPVVAVAPVLDAPQTVVAKGTPMPEGIIEYLRWLKAYEKDRLALQAKSEGQMMLVMTQLVKTGMAGTPEMGLLNGDSEDTKGNTSAAPQPAIDEKAINGVIGDWNQAASIFQQKTPPNPCATLATNYGSGINSSVTAMTQILGAGVRAVNSIAKAGGEKTGDASEVLSFLKDEHNNKGLSQGIEASFGAANDALDALRARYTDIPADIDKAQFTIKSGGSSGPSIPIPGLGM